MCFVREEKSAKQTKTTFYQSLDENDKKKQRA